MTVLQRQVEITCTGVTQGGVITGDLFVGTGGQRRDFAIELVASGLATVDQRKIDCKSSSFDMQGYGQYHSKTLYLNLSLIVPLLHRWRSAKDYDRFSDGCTEQ